MQRLWSFFKGRSSPDSLEPSDASVPLPPPIQPLAAPPSREPEPEPEPVDVASLGLPQRVIETLEQALAADAHALLYDPEEYTCMVCVIGNGAITQIAEWSLEDYRDARPLVSNLDRCAIRFGQQIRRVQVHHAVTDLGQRVIVQFFLPEWDAEIVAERRKANVRLMNRLRPGTSLSRHNRDILLRTLRRAEQRPPPSFLERLEREGLVPEAVLRADEQSEVEKLEKVVRREVLPRKAVAKALADYLGLEFVDVEEERPQRECAQRFTHKQVLDWEAIPWADCDAVTVVAIADPTDAETRGRIEALLGRSCEWRVAAATDIRVAAEKIFKVS